MAMLLCVYTDCKKWVIVSQIEWGRPLAQSTLPSGQHCLIPSQGESKILSDAWQGGAVMQLDKPCPGLVQAGLVILS